MKSKMISQRVLHPQYIVDELGNKTNVILTKKEYKGLLDDIDDLLGLLADGGGAQIQTTASQNDTQVEKELSLLKKHHDHVHSIMGDLNTFQRMKKEAQRQLLMQKLMKNLETTLQEMRSQLGEVKQFSKPADLFNFPELPKNLVINTAELKNIKNTLLADSTESSRPPLIIQAPAGAGKSVYCNALGRDADIRSRYSDGIYWVNLGQDADVLGLLSQLIRDIEQDQSLEFIDDETASEYLQELCKTRSCLFILDDVRDAQDIMVFNISAEACQIIINGNDDEVMNIVKYFIPLAQELNLKTATEEQGLKILARYSRMVNFEASKAPVQMKQVVKLAQHLPQCLKYLSYAITDPNKPDWASLIQVLQDEDFELPEKYPRPLMLALQSKVDELGESAEYYYALAVFAGYTAIPQKAIELLWQYLYQLSAEESNEFINKLVLQDLLRVHTVNNVHYINLSSAQYEYLVAESEAELDKLHNHLLTAYRRHCGQHGWMNGPNDHYFFQHLATHLHYAKRTNELKTLLVDYDWINKKLQHCSIHSLVMDYEFLEGKEIELIKQALYDAAPSLASSRDELANQLLDHLWEKNEADSSLKSIQALINQAQEIAPDWYWEPPFPDEML